MALHAAPFSFPLSSPTPFDKGFPRTARPRRRGAGGSGQVQTLAEIRAAAPARAEDKPIFSSAVATLAFINPDQTLYYAANPDNNRKVVEQGPGQWYCEYSGTTLPTMVRRYILQVRGGRGVVFEEGEKGGGRRRRFQLAAPLSAVRAMPACNVRQG